MSGRHARGGETRRTAGTAEAPAGAAEAPAGGTEHATTDRAHEAADRRSAADRAGSAVLPPPRAMAGDALHELTTGAPLDPTPLDPARRPAEAPVALAPRPAARRLMVQVDAVDRTYRSGSTEVHALRGVGFTVEEGTLLAVKGRSGSGKTTLLNCIGGLDQPDAGRVVVDGVDLGEAGEDGRLALRRDVIGFVFQSFGLIPILSAAENVGVPMRLARTDPAVRDERVRGLLDLVGLSTQANQRPYELSGGQQQRVAIARALANSPKLLLADEPTGQLDSRTGLAVMQLLSALVRSQGVTAVIATHDPVLLEFADRVIELRDGVMISDQRRDDSAA